MERKGKRMLRFPESASSPSRRDFISGAAIATSTVALPAFARAALQDSVRPSDNTDVTPDAVLAEIMAGNSRFVAGKPIAHLQDLAIVRARSAEGQAPIAGVLACADSRVPVEMVFDEHIGRLFVTRVAGNITTPEIIASLEYGVAALGIKVVMVLGHTNCGAVKSAMANAEVPGQISALFPSLLPAIYLNRSGDPQDVARTNAIVQTATLLNASSVIEAKVQSGQLKVVPALYNVATGTVDLLDIPATMRVR